MRNRILLLFVVLFVFVGCTTRFGELPESSRTYDTIEEALDGAALQREKSVSQKDMDSFMDSLDKGYHPTYYQEQQRWFEDAVAQRISEFRCSIAEVIKQEGQYVHVRLDESYIFEGVEYNCNYPVVFRIEQQGGYSASLCGYDFQSMENEYAVFYYVEENADMVQQLCEKSKSEIKRVYDTFGYTPDEKLTINLYPGQKHMIWSVKPSLPHWVGGWAEAEESVKMCYFGMYSAKEYLTTLAHEACHMVVSDLSNNNASYWLQEGLASLMENDDMGVDEYDKAVLQLNDSTDSLMDFRRLQYEDYEALDDQFVVSGYYACCKVVASLLYEEYGVDGIIKLLKHMGEWESGAVGYNLDKLRQMSEANMGAIQEVFNTTEQKLSDKYDNRMSELVGGVRYE